MSVIPTGYLGGTSLIPTISSYETLALNIKQQLGHPLINIEVSDQQLYTYISNAIQFFTKWAGYTEEYLIFDSKKYVKGVGINIATLINQTPEMYNSAVSGLSAAYDYDLNSYRKVIDVFAFEQGESTGINTLFTLEQAMAQQIYSSYMIGSFGFDLVSWEVLKGWTETRKRVLAQIPYFRFDNRTQTLRIIPEPIPQESYLGLVGCYMERPIKDLVQELWVMRYSLALTKIGVGYVRKKYAGTSLFGGGSVDTSILDEGKAEKDTLEKELMTSYQDSTPPMFFLGILMGLLSIGSMYISSIT